MPGLQVPQAGQVGGPWGGTMYPEWFQSGIGANMTPEHAANLFADYVSQHENDDFGWYWNQFKLSAPMGQNGRRFGTGTPNNPAGDPPAGDPPPGGNPPPAGNPPPGDPPRPTAPGGQTPGRWVVHASTVNGVRRARWRWHVDPVRPAPPAPPAAPPPAGPPVGDPPEQEPPGHNPPQPPTPQPPANDNQGGWTQGGQGGGMYNGGGMGMARNSVAGGQTSGARMIAPQGPGPTKPPPKPGPFPNPMPPTVPPNSTAAPSTDPALNQVKNSFTGNPAYGKKKPAYNSGYNPNLGN